MSVSIQDFLQAVGQLPNVSTDEVTKAVDALPAEKRGNLANVAKELVVRKLLTREQVNSIYGGLSKQPAPDAAATAAANESGVDPLKNLKRRSPNGSTAEAAKSRASTDSNRPAQPDSDTAGVGENLKLPIAAVAASAVILMASIAFAVVRFQSPSKSELAAIAAKAAADEAAAKKAAAEASLTPEARAVAWVLSQQGTVVVRPEGATTTLRIAPGGHLPEKPCDVIGVSITGRDKIADGRVEKLSGLPDLEAVDVHGTQFADAGLGDLNSSTGLTTLILSNTGVSDSGIEKLAAFPKLDRLDLIGQGKITDASVATLRSLSALHRLNVSDTGMAVDGVATLMAALPDCQIAHSLPTSEIAKVLPTKKEEEATRLASITPSSPTPETPTPEVPAERPPRSPPAMAAPEEGQTVDVLKVVDVAQDTIDGTCKLDGGKLSLSGDKGARLQLPIEAPADYVLTITAERIAGKGPLGVALRVGRGEAQAMLGGDDNQVNGLEPIDGVDYERNSSGRNVPAFASSGPSTFIFRVARHEVCVSRDDALLINWKGEPKQQLASKRGKDGFDGGLGLISSEGSSFRIAKIELSVPKDQAAPPQPKPIEPRLKPTLAPEQPIDLLSAIDLNQDTHSDGWQFDALGLVSSADPAARLQIPIVPPENYALVIEAERLAPGGFVIGLVVDGVQCGITPEFKRKAGMQTYDGKTIDQTYKAKTSDFFRDKGLHSVVCIVRKAEVQLIVDGVTLVDWSGMTKKLGVPSEMRVPERTQLWLGTYASHRFTRYDMIPLAKSTVVTPFLRSHHVATDLRLKLPGDDALKNGQREVRDMYRDDFSKARQASDKFTLARKLFIGFCKSKKDPDVRYAMLNEARDLAIDAGEMSLVDRTVSAMAETYQVDDLGEQLELYQKISPKVRGVPQNRELAENSLGLADLFIARDRFDAAKSASDVALTFARKAQDPAFVKHITERAKRVVTAKQAFEPFEKAALTLQTDPNNGDANLAIGLVRCFDHQDWGGGLPYLARSSDKALADLATQSLNTKFDTKAELKTAEAWWDAAEANSKQRARWILGARYFYRQALLGLSSEESRKPIEDRLAEIGKIRGDAASSLPSLIELNIAPGLSMKFRLIPAGEFVMGTDTKSKTSAAHSVKITKPFYVSITEVTQEQFHVVTGVGSPELGPQFPFYSDDGKSRWSEANKFCDQLNALPAFAAYTARLPTEAEWEYAARGNAKTNYTYGDDEKLLSQYACFAHLEPEPVGILRPNDAGIFDVQGNVSEWCSDWELSSYYASSPAEDPPGPTTGKERAYRGGQFDSTAEDCRLWNRRPGSAGRKAIGIRIVLAL